MADAATKTWAEPKKKSWWARRDWVKYTRADVYPEFTVELVGEVPQLPDPAVHPHPCHLDDRYSTDVAVLSGATLPAALKTFQTLHLRQLKGSGMRFAIATGPAGNPVPTHQDLQTFLETNYAPQKQKQAEEALKALLTNPETLMLAFGAYALRLQLGDPRILKDYMDRVLGKPKQSIEVAPTSPLGVFASMSPADVLKLAAGQDARPAENDPLAIPAHGKR